VKRSGTTTSWLPIFQVFDGTSYAETNFLQLVIYQDSIGLATDTTWFKRTAAVYRDYSAWMHIVCAFDTTQSTASNRVRLYVNGSEVATGYSDGDPAQNTDYGVNRAVAHQIGQRYDGAYFDGYLADVHFIDGQALDPSYFTTTDATTGQLIPKAYSGGSYGTNGFKLNFSSNSTTAALGTDSSGNGNTWTTNNFSVTAGSGNDSLVDTPTSYGTDTGAGGEVRGNYCTWNPLWKSDSILSDGNLTAQRTTGSDRTCPLATIGVSSGKWYWEHVFTAVQTYCYVGVAEISMSAATYGGTAGTPSLATEIVIGTGASSPYNGTIATGGSATSAGTYSIGTVVGVALDLASATKTITFYANGTSTGDTRTITSSNTLFPLVGFYNSGSNSVNSNFGQRAFAYPVSGFKALCDANLSTGSITTSGTFTGNASTNGPFVYLNGVPTAMTINGNAVTFATHADKLANGFKLRSASGSYNTAGSNTYSITTTGANFKVARAQANP
jgi:hypothetical protein